MSRFPYRNPNSPYRHPSHPHREAPDSFIGYLQSKDLSKSTQEHYNFYVERFITWLGKDILTTTKKEIINYLAYLKQLGNQQHVTRRNNLIALNHYFTYLFHTDQITDIPTAFIKIRGTQKRQLHYIFSRTELEQLNDSYYHHFLRDYDDSHIPKNQRLQSYLSRERNAILLGLLTYQGVPTNELQGITLGDIDIQRAKLTLSKKGKRRTLDLEASQIGNLMHYLHTIRPQYLQFRTEATNQLLLTLPVSGRTTTNGNNLMGTIKPLRKQLQQLTPKLINCMQIRASVITHWIKTEGLRKAQYNAGHRHITSTEHYLPNDLESLTDELKQFHPF